MKIIAAIGLVFSAAIAFSQVDPGKVVATVNGDQIKGQEYYTHMEYLPNMGRLLESGGVVPVTPGLLSIIELVNHHILLQMAKDKNLSPTDQEIDALMKQSTTDDPNLEARWAAQGRSEADLREEYRTTVAQFKLQTEGITVSDQEVAQFYHDQAIPGLTVEPRTVKLRLISVTDPQGEKSVDTDLANGQSFGDVAKARSQDSTQQNSGELGTVPTDALPKDVVDILDKTKVGKTTDWTDEGVGSGVIHVKYLIEGKAQEKPLVFATVKEQIRRRIMLDRGNVKNNVEAEMKEYRKKSQITIPNKGLAEAYRNFMLTNYHEVVPVTSG
jgi:foldase protein PrsA